MTELCFLNYLAEFRIVVWKMAEKLPCLSYSWKKKKTFQLAARPGCPAGFGSSVVKGRRAVALQCNGTVSSHKYMGASGLSFLQTN